MTSDVGSILMFIRSGIIQLISDLILSLAIAVLLVWLQWRLAIVALVALPLYAVNQRFFFAHLRKLSDEIRAQVSALYALLSERISAVPSEWSGHSSRKRPNLPRSTNGSTGTGRSPGPTPAPPPRWGLWLR